MIKVKQEDDVMLVKAAVTDFAESLGYCQFKIPLSIKGLKPEQTQALAEGFRAHHEEEVYEQEHVELEPVTPEQIQDSKEDIEFARENIFSRFMDVVQFPSQPVVVSLSGRVDKIMRLGQTLIVQDDKFVSNPQSYENKSQPYVNHMLQVMTYLNSSYGTKNSPDPENWFSMPHSEKMWKIRICDRKSREPYKIFSNKFDSFSAKFFQESLRIFAGVATGMMEPEHHNSKRKCDACGLKNFCDHRIL
jgi:hypothetical protein